METCIQERKKELEGAINDIPKSNYSPLKPLREIEKKVDSIPIVAKV